MKTLVTGGNIKVLKKELKDWTDWDVAQFALARCLGILDKDVSFQTDAKHIFWTENPLGTTLCGIMCLLVNEGVLECFENQKYRWNKSYGK